MKKKIWIPIAIAALVLILFLPIPSEKYDDGGSRSYTALTYKIVDWNRLGGDNGVYDATRIYFFPDNFKSIDELWELEIATFNYPTLKLEVVEIKGDSIIADVIDSKDGQPGGYVSFSTKNLDFMYLSTYDLIEVSYTGFVRETYPAQIDVIDWKVLDIACNCEEVHTEAHEWLDKENAIKFEDSAVYADYQKNTNLCFNITDVYSDCIFAKISLNGEAYKVKLNCGTYHEWCVGDYILCSFENAYCDETMRRIEGDLLTAELSNHYTYDKPVIYLYPEEETQVTVNLILNGKLTCTYPIYENGWNVTASPDGTLTDQNGQTYNYLYWEGESGVQYDLTRGFCVKGEDTAGFLENALSNLGLNRREANEFIVYWLPLMEQNPYNIISFQTEAYTNSAQLKINPSPDTLIRVFMAWQPSDSFVDLPAQELITPERTGFTVVEWGGTEID